MRSDRAGLAAPALLAAIACIAYPWEAAQAQETSPACKVDAFLSCGWMYIPPKYDGKTLFPSGIYEMSDFPDAGLCTPECLDIIHGPHCDEEKGMLMEACNALQCSVDVKAACGVSDIGDVTWWKACKPECEAAMLSSTCEGTEDIYAEFKRYKESFGPFGSECSTWKCMKELDDKCDSFDSELQYLPAQAMCDVECYAAMTSDVCRLAHVSVLMPDGSKGDFSQSLPNYGPQADICNLPFQDVSPDLIDLLPLQAKTPPARATPPPCPEDLPGPCWYLDTLPGAEGPDAPSDAFPADYEQDQEQGEYQEYEEMDMEEETEMEMEMEMEEEEEIVEVPVPGEGASVPRLGQENAAPDPAEARRGHSVQFMASLAFESAPEGFPSTPDAAARRLLLQSSPSYGKMVSGPFEVTEVPDSFATEYKKIIATFASSGGFETNRGHILDPEEDVIIHKVDQYFFEDDEGKILYVLDIDTEVIFEDPDHAAWFATNVPNMLASLFARLGKIIGSAFGSRGLDINDLESGLSVEPVLTDSRGQPNQPIVVRESRAEGGTISSDDGDVEPSGVGAWVYILGAVGGAAGLAGITFLVVLGVKKKSNGEEAGAAGVVSDKGEEADIKYYNAAADPVSSEEVAVPIAEPETQLDLPEGEVTTADVDSFPLPDEGEVAAADGDDDAVTTQV